MALVVQNKRCDIESKHLSNTTSATRPLTVESAAGGVTSLEPGSRDGLCGQIAKLVDGVEVRLGEALVTRFTDGSTLSVSLRAEDYEGPEAIHAQGFRDGQWTVI